MATNPAKKTPARKANPIDREAEAAQADKAENFEDAKKAGGYLRVIAKRDGFRRAGRVFSGEAAYIPLDELSFEQYLALDAEPMLVTDMVAPEVAEKAQAGG